jgi:hypothetical protein
MRDLNDLIELICGMGCGEAEKRQKKLIDLIVPVKLQRYEEYSHVYTYSYRVNKF